MSTSMTLNVANATQCARYISKWENRYVIWKLIQPEVYNCVKGKLQAKALLLKTNLDQISPLDGRNVHQIEEVGRLKREIHFDYLEARKIKIFLYAEHFMEHLGSGIVETVWDTRKDYKEKLSGFKCSLLLDVYAHTCTCKLHVTPPLFLIMIVFLNISVLLAILCTKILKHKPRKASPYFARYRATLKLYTCE